MLIDEIIIGEAYAIRSKRGVAIAIEKAQESAWNKRMVRMVRYRLDDGTEDHIPAREIDWTWEELLAIRAGRATMEALVQRTTTVLDEHGIRAYVAEHGEYITLRLSPDQAEQLLALLESNAT